MKLGFIGFGEAAFEMSMGLKGEGLKNVVAFDPLWNDTKFGQLIQERANNAEVILKKAPDEVVSTVDVVIVAVPADKALAVSQSLLPNIKVDSIYVDVSASTPDVKLEISQCLNEKGTSFVDAAMMGPLPVYKHQVPMLASGNGTDRFIDMMSAYSMNISKVSDTAGEASAVKLIRSIFMKGLPSLLIEMLEAARKFNVEELVIKSISETMDSKTFEETMNRLVTGTSIHALRRSVELQGTIKMLEKAKLDHLMSKGACEKLQQLGEFNFKEKFQGRSPNSWSQVIDAMEVKNM
ncbi:NAD(P)-dependent oxidoreductase [Halalkalibacter alkaliphilus]|uniref:Prephenate dehydrogenase/arogenate dehydrogenase family protein n=1 Tax=Halalkalibacter alkaliphilus TaxID=2917993 RepID=A0A9X2CV11_9BACI|nr:NAD(P)-dependent oxidoreductase [Halalkalibacter alkaliphilus]MCL7748841.1 prephenate dehydrogenase/arogenate dehydrogenase family protein [Halalkalibacter alkaliphilus]